MTSASRRSNQILTEMDGSTGNEGVIVLAATNRPEILDWALLRAGRFDRRITVNPPDQDGRLKILQVHTRNVPLKDPSDLKAVAASTGGMVGADLKDLVNEAALIGATLGAIVVAMATVPVNFPTATIVWIVFIIVWQRFEDYVVQPVVYRRALKVNPIVTIISLLVGAELLGILGVLLAIPTAAAIQIILRDWWSARKPEVAVADDDEASMR
jgi:hypothetical protein